MSPLEQRFWKLCGEGHDISEHLGLLHGLASDHRVKSIIEIGFREGVSATALAWSGKPVFSMDINPCKPAVSRLMAIAPNFSFMQRDSLKMSATSCDLLHIDSLHTHQQLLAELRRHGPLCSLWIACHDTHTFGMKGKDGSKPGLLAAIDQFVEEENGRWEVALSLNNNNGMTLLRRRG